MSDQQPTPRRGLHETRREILENAVVHFLNHIRILYVAGGILVATGSIALMAVLMARIPSIVPVGILMIIAGLFELGVGHKGRDPDGPATPWMQSGGAHMVAGVFTMLAPLWPSILFTTVLGAAFTFAGLWWLRAGFALPPRFQSPIVIVCGGFTGLLGLLILSRWHGLNTNLLALMLGTEILVRGWSLIGFGFGLQKAVKRS